MRIEEQLGMHIRDRRTELGWTQRELAEKLGISPTHMGAIERGERNPSIGLLLEIAQLFRTTLDSLVSDDEWGDDIATYVSIVRDQSPARRQIALDLLRLIFQYLDSPDR